MNSRLFPRGYILGIVLALAFVLTILSANYQVPRDSRCYGHLSGGFPLAFLCDDDAGSPTTSWGKIDEADWYGGFVVFTPAFILNTLFYAVLLSITWLLAFGISWLMRWRIPAP